MTLWSKYSSSSGSGRSMLLLWTTAVHRPSPPPVIPPQLRHATRSSTIKTTTTTRQVLRMIHYSSVASSSSFSSIIHGGGGNTNHHHHHHHTGFLDQFRTNPRMTMTIPLPTVATTTMSQNRSFSSSSSGSSGSGNSSSSSSSSNPQDQAPPPLSATEPFVPMTASQEEAEKLRVAALTLEQRDYELRQYNRQLAVLQMKRGINTGELYTWAGKYKALARDYGMPLLIWYWTIWATTGIVCYGTITLFNVDTIYLLQQLDAQTGFHLSEQVNPEHGKIGMALIVNEIIEPIRLPIVIVTVKPVIDKMFPPKY